MSARHLDLLDIDHTRHSTALTAAEAHQLAIDNRHGTARSRRTGPQRLERIAGGKKHIVTEADIAMQQQLADDLDLTELRDATAEVHALRDEWHCDLRRCNQAHAYALAAVCEQATDTMKGALTCVIPAVPGAATGVLTAPIDGRTFLSDDAPTRQPHTRFDDVSDRERAHLNR